MDGASLGLIWGLPFAGLLLSIAVLPLAVPSVWHRHDGKIAAFWGLCVAIPLMLQFGAAAAAIDLLRMLLLSYLPFIVLLLALFTITGGIWIEGRIGGSTARNTLALGIGAALASIMGTTGASMLLIRPLIRANGKRKFNAHVFVFFIFLVGNIGGSLTPLGDPPLFLGFLSGVAFFWPLVHLALPMLFCTVILLAVFAGIDSYVYRRDGGGGAYAPPFELRGAINLVLLALVLAVVFASGLIDLGLGLMIYSVPISGVDLARDIVLLVLAGISMHLTPENVREAHDFSWAPMLEVGMLFMAIFVTLIPVLAMLEAGEAGALAGLHAALWHDGRPVNGMFFWLAGGLSSFLDNAPTYLIFFHAAGGDARQLMADLSVTLGAISAGAVFMGANSYIGNAPNFMVKSVVEGQGIRMPGFLTYMLWAACILLPLFAITGLIFFPS